MQIDYKKLCEELKELNRLYSLNNYGFECALKDNVGEASEAIKALQIELAAMRGAANSYKMENERLKAKLSAALSDLNKVSICGTCVHYTPHGKQTKCNLKNLWQAGGNWAGCSRWRWRGEKGDQ